MTRLNLQEPLANNLGAIAQHYGLDEIYSFEDCSVSIQQTIRLGKQLYREDRIIDCTDMIVLPVILQKDNELEIKPYPFVLVDECQDLNPAQRNLSLLLAGDTGRLIYVGLKKSL